MSAWLLCMADRYGLQPTFLVGPNFLTYKLAQQLVHQYWQGIGLWVS